MDLCVCRAVPHTYSHSALLWPQLPSCKESLFLPLLKEGFTEVQLPLLTGSALASGRSTLEPAGSGSVGHGESFWQLLWWQMPPL